MQIIRLNKKGLSLTETLIVSAIGALISVVVMVLIFTVSSGVATINGQATLQSEVTVALYTFDQDARLASYLLPDSDLNSAGDGAAYVNLGFLPLNADGYPASAEGIDIIRYEFSQAEGAIRRIVIPTPASSRQPVTQVLTHNITDVEFIPNWIDINAFTLSSIRMKLQGQRNESGKVLSFALSSAAASRVW